MSTIEMIITARDRDLGGFSVRRLLPYATHRMVGPFIFFDHMGPAVFPPGKGLDVRPHPHIALATVTYLFEGKIHHRDSLGSDQFIEPGAINWMTAGRGIVHSERTPEDSLRTGARMNGIQLWVALPEKFENTPPSFVHHPADTLPEFQVKTVSVKLLLGSAFGRTSPVKVHSELFYFQTLIPAGAHFSLPGAPGVEAAFYLETGTLQMEAQKIETQSMVVGKKGATLTVQAEKPARVMWLGGKPVGERFIFWNFVASSEAAIESAKQDWLKGPGNTDRFPLIPGDDNEFIPLPDSPPPPKGTIL